MWHAGAMIEERPDLRYEIEPGDGTVLVRVAGELDLATVDTLNAALAALPPGDVVLDLTGLAFADSTGLRALVIEQERLAGTGDRLVVVHAKAAVRRTLEISGLDQVLEVRE